MSGLPRTVIKWLQGLDLTFPFTNPKWDFSNGFLVAEILSCYYPRDVEIFQFNTGNSLQSKLGNWSLLKKFIVKSNFDIPMDLIDGTIHSREGASILFIENLYQILTNKMVQKPVPTYEIDLTDWPYQQQLPLHARSTAVQAIRNNVKNSEILTDPNSKLLQKKIQDIVENHTERRRAERLIDPSRFNKKLTIAEKAIRRPADAALFENDDTYDDEELDFSTFKSNRGYGTTTSANAKTSSNDSNNHNNTLRSTDDKNYKEISVKQEAYQLNLGTVN